MQQAIEQISPSAREARMTGAESAPNKIATVPMRALSPFSRFCGLAIADTGDSTPADFLPNAFFMISAQTSAP
jgi:hypothetical protein